MESGVGFAFRLMIGGVAQTWTLPGLVFADDLVLLAERSSDLQRLVTLAADHLKSLGLHFNAKKSAILQFSGVETIDVQLPDGGSIPVSDKYRYLGVNLCTSADLYDKQEEHVRQASVRAANVLRRRSLWGCNRFVLVRELWKAVHVPVLTFANAVVCLSAATRQWLERGQREVGRLALACHGRVAVEAVQGDLGWSSYEAREARSKAAYEGRLRLMNDQRWARRVFRYTAIKGMNTPWRRRLHNLCRKYSLFTDPVQEDSERKWAVRVRNRVQEAETSMWQAAMEKNLALPYTEPTRPPSPPNDYTTIVSAVRFCLRPVLERSALGCIGVTSTRRWLTALCSAGHAGRTRRALNTWCFTANACVLVRQMAPHYRRHSAL